MHQILSHVIILEKATTAYMWEYLNMWLEDKRKINVLFTHTHTSLKLAVHTDCKNKLGQFWPSWMCHCITGQVVPDTATARQEPLIQQNNVTSQ